MKTERTLSRAFLSTHPVEAARVLERFSPEKTAPFLEEIPAKGALEILLRMGESYARLTLELMTPGRAAGIFSSLPQEVSASLIRGMDAKKREPILAELPSAVSQSIKVLLRFPKDTAGAVMDSRVLSFPADLPVHQALERIRQNPGLMTHYAYVVDERGILAGVTTLTELMLARPHKALRAVMKTPIEHLSVLDHADDIIGHSGWKRFHKLPVVDRSGRFLGVVRYKTLRGLEGREFEPKEETGIFPFIMLGSQLYWTGLGSAIFAFSALLRGFRGNSPETGSERHGD